jgi:hypothetical protein
VVQTFNKLEMEVVVEVEMQVERFRLWQRWR